MAAVDDLLTCAICLEWFKSPRRFPCHHVFCLTCLQGLVKQGTDYVTCPECRRDHVIPPNEAVGELFPVDGRLEQFMEKQKPPKTAACQECQTCCSLSECEHCGVQTCQQCQTKHGVRTAVTFLHDLTRFCTEFCTEHHKTTRFKLMTELLNDIENLNDLKTKLNHEIDTTIMGLENRRVVLLSRIAEEEKLILENISDLKRANFIADEYANSNFTDDVVENYSVTKVLVQLSDKLTAQKHLMTSVIRGHEKRGKLSIKLGERRKLDEITESYGVLYTEIEYKKDFRIIATLNGSESVGKFKRPWGLTNCGITGNVYVTDETSIRQYTSKGDVIRHAIFNDIKCGLTIDSKQRVIVASFQNKNVKIYDHDLKLIKSFGSEGKQSVQSVQLSSPMGVACDKEDNIYVADKNLGSIIVFTSNGIFKTVIGNGVLKEPWDVKINQRQELVVTNTGRGRVDLFHRDGAHLRSIFGKGKNKLKSPRGICLDDNGCMLVADHTNKNIQVYEDDGSHYCTINGPTAAMKDMRGLTVTAAGNIFITNITGHKIHLIATTCQYP